MARERKGREHLKPKTVLQLLALDSKKAVLNPLAAATFTKRAATSSPIPTRSGPSTRPRQVPWPQNFLSGFCSG